VGVEMLDQLEFINPKAICWSCLLDARMERMQNHRIAAKAGSSLTIISNIMLPVVLDPFPVFSNAFTQVASPSDPQKESAVRRVSLFPSNQPKGKSSSPSFASLRMVLLIYHRCR
jgi:hypothetical protein